MWERVGHTIWELNMKIRRLERKNVNKLKKWNKLKINIDIKDKKVYKVYMVSMY